MQKQNGTTALFKRHNAHNSVIVDHFVFALDIEMIASNPIEKLKGIKTKSKQFQS